MRFSEDVHDCIKDLLLLNNKNKKLAIVRKVKLELKNKVGELDKCRHCGDGEAAYCEKCYQNLIAANTALQLENINLCNDINSRGYWPSNPLKRYETTSESEIKSKQPSIPKLTTYNPYITPGDMMFGMEGPDEPEEIWIKPKNESEVKCDGNKKEDSSI